MGDDPQGAGPGRTNLINAAHLWRQEVCDVEAVVKHDATAGAAQCAIILSPVRSRLSG